MQHNYYQLPEPDYTKTHFIRKRGMYYALGSRGYTEHPLLAEVYTKEEAKAEEESTHGECTAVPIINVFRSTMQLEQHLQRIACMHKAIEEQADGS